LCSWGTFGAFGAAGKLGEGSRSFLKKRTKKLLSYGSVRFTKIKSFLVLFLKKNGFLP
jgi:hypothetical protein